MFLSYITAERVFQSVLKFKPTANPPPLTNIFFILSFFFKLQGYPQRMIRT